MPVSECDVADEPRYQLRAQQVERMREPVVDHRHRARIAEQDFGDAGGRRVALVRRLQVADQQRADRRQLAGELAGDQDGAFAQLGAGEAAGLGAEHQSAAHLLVEQRQRGVERVADEVVDAFVGQPGASVMGGEQHRAQSLQYADQRRLRRQFADRALVPDLVRDFARLAQLLDDRVEVPVHLGRGGARMSISHSIS